ncbi:MAG: lytic murein transglycosylase B [Pseudomonadales bacterium]
MKPVIAFFMAALLAAGNCLAAGNYAERDDVHAFVQELVAEEGFEEQALLDLFRQAEYKQSIVDAISRPAEKTHTWATYQDIFLTDLRKRRGLAFMRQNRNALAAAYETYGVPPVVVTAIIGVETMYGRITGSFRVLDALSTLGFDYPPRAKFFRQELKSFILLAREERQPATSLTGSYAGAMGLGQFIPSSYRHYAVDFDNDGFRDIWNNRTDAIGSVANYLAEHGWRRDEPITLRVAGSRAPSDIYNVSLKPGITVDELRGLGVSGTGLLPGDEVVSPVLLKGKEGDEHWLGLNNFYVITRYNRSRLYAMAVVQLSESLLAGE